MEKSSKNIIRNWRRFAIFLVACLLYVCNKQMINAELTNHWAGDLAVIFFIGFLWQYIRAYVNRLGYLDVHKKYVSKKLEAERRYYMYKRYERRAFKLAIKLRNAYVKIKEIGEINRKQRLFVEELKYLNNLLRKEAADQQERARVAEAKIQCYESFLRVCEEFTVEESEARKAIDKLRNTLKLHTVNPAASDDSISELLTDLSERTEKEDLDRSEELTQLIGRFLSALNVINMDAARNPHGHFTHSYVELYNNTMQELQKLKYFNS